jgi:short-subunit dehydrogenase
MTNPVVLITGASAGLGVEFARQLSARGARLVLVARRKERLEALCEEVGDARALALDLVEPGAAERVMADLAAHGEHVDLLVNNAGFGFSGPVARIEADKQRDMVTLNCTVLTELARAVLPGMIERGRGGILNVASVAAFQAAPRFAVYAATKAYVLSFSEALHEEVAAKGVHVSCLCPGPVATEFFDAAGMTVRGAFKTMMMQADEVVRIALRGLDRNQAVVVAGAANKVGAVGVQLLPRRWVRKIAGRMRY